MTEETYKEICDRIKDLKNDAYNEGWNDSQREYSDGYARGVEDTWKCARSISSLTYQEKIKLFRCTTTDEVLYDFDAVQAMTALTEHNRETQSGNKEFLRIVVSGLPSKPYYTIDYRQYGKEMNGYGSYDLNYVMEWADQMRNGTLVLEKQYQTEEE